MSNIEYVAKRIKEIYKEAETKIEERECAYMLTVILNNRKEEFIINKYFERVGAEINYICRELERSK
jgi:hypothetical protein